MKCFFLLTLVCGVTALHAADFTTQSLFDASALIPTPREELFINPDGSPDWSIAEKLTLGAESSVFGWGNHEGKQPHNERVPLWDGPMTVRVKLRSTAAAKVTFLVWCDGRIGGKLGESSTVRKANRQLAKPVGLALPLKGGDEWQTLEFPTNSIKHPDGFELEFAGAAGTTVEIESVRFVREMHAGVWRKEFTLPEGKIWRAVGEVSMMCSLFVNGAEVPSANGMLVRPSFNHSNGEMFENEALDFGPLLKSGANALALHCARNSTPPYVYFTLTVVMESGDVVRVTSDGTWFYSQDSTLADAAKVSVPGFDAAAWKAADARRGSNLNYKTPVARPAYAGRLLLRSPDEPYLFFKDSAPVRIQVAVPPGLAGASIDWQVQAFRDGALVDGPSGNATAGAIDVGSLARGVYVLHATLKRGDEVLEERIAEPFVVFGNVPMRETAGASIADGLDLELEAEIDFTNPDGPIPSQETAGKKGSVVLVTKPTITEQNGLRYRETGPDQGALISHQYTFQHPGDFYLMELEFPDDAQRWFGVSCTSSTHAHTSKDGPATWTGQKYPLSGEMRTMQWIYRPDPGPTAINLSNLQRDAAGAAASRLSISHIKDGLPALTVADGGARLIGQLTERTSPIGGFSKTFGFFPEPVAEQRFGATEKDNDPVLAMCRALAHDLDAAEHYAQWLRFTGQNLHVMGCLQYFESNTGYIAPTGSTDSRILADPRDTAVRVFRENGIQVIASLEYVCSQTLIAKYPVNDGEVALGADTPYLVDKDGRQPWNWLGRYGLNFLHPEVEASMRQIALDLQRKYAGQPNFLGVNFTSYLGGDFLPSFTTQGLADPLATSFDDVTAARFSADTGIAVPGAANDPERFSQRAEFLLAEANKETWLQWRTEKTRDFFTQMQQDLGASRNYISLYVDVQHAQAMQETGMPPRDYMRQFGWSPEVYQNQPGLWFPKWTHATQRYNSLVPIARNSTWPAAWNMSVGEDYNRTFDQPENRASFIMTHWQEHETFAEALPERDDWPRPFQMTYQALPNGDFARELFTQNLVTTDPEMVVWGFCDLVMQTGHEQPLREFARTLRCLPKAKLMPALGTSLQTDLVLREVRDGDSLWFIAANPCPWPSQSEVYLTGANGIRDAASASGTLAAEIAANGNTILTLDLKPYEVRAFRADSPDAKLHGWKSLPSPEVAFTHIRAVIDDAGTLMENKTLSARLADTDRDFLLAQIAAAENALASQHSAEAWAIVSDSRFWSLARTQWLGGKPR